VANYSILPTMNGLVGVKLKVHLFRFVVDLLQIHNNPVTIHKQSLSFTKQGIRVKPFLQSKPSKVHRFGDILNLCVRGT